MADKTSSSESISIAAASNPHVRRWLTECALLCEPARVRVLNGGPPEKAELIAQAVAERTLIPLNQKKLPGCYLHRSQQNDVARTEQNTFICVPEAQLAGPTNNWLSDQEAYARLRALFAGAMRGRTMYVIPFLMGPPGSRLAKVGVQATDSIYVAISMGIMTRMGEAAWDHLGSGDAFTRCLHSVGDCNPARRYICHFPRDNTIWSFGSGYGGNALLGKKCLALRLGSYFGSQEGWLAEHMLLLGVTSPEGDKTYLAAAFPSACGKTNLAMLIPPAKDRAAGWKVTTVGDDIVWMSVNPADGRLWASNPEAGYFGVLPGISAATSANVMELISHDTLYTNAALLPDGDAWWEGKTAAPPRECLDWMGQPWTPDCGRKAAHPNSRFTAPLANNPVLDPRAGDSAGVPVSALIFGGRRSNTVPLVFQAFDWVHGVFLGATLSSETTAAAAGEVGVVRRDPMAMLPFCGYHVADYFSHWLRMGKKMKDPPPIFHVNWFRKDSGNFLWPGFGENMRVLKWIIDRCRNRQSAAETVLGWMPRPGDIDLDGLDMDGRQLEAAQAIDPEAWKQEVQAQQDFFQKLGGDLPKELLDQHRRLAGKLQSVP